MRHQKHGVKLGRDTNARKALARNLANSLFEKGQVTTTLAKAKFAKPYVEKLISAAKKKSLTNSRVLASKLQSQAFTNLTKKIGPYFSQKTGGYTRIVKLGPRRGDAAPMARLELLEWAKIVITESTGKKQKAQKADHRKHKISVPSKHSVPSVIKKSKKIKSEKK